MDYTASAAYGVCTEYTNHNQFYNTHFLVI